MEHFGLVGEHLGHSLSVPIHEAILHQLGLPADYRLIPLPRESFTHDASILLKELDGFNVTIPYKQEIISLLPRLNPAAESIGAVNTVDCRACKGFNTDAKGFEVMLTEHGIDPTGQDCYVLGTGGACKAICWTLRQLHAGRVVVVSRHPSEEQISYEQLAQQFSGVLVNCTPAGMWPDVTGCPLSPNMLTELLSRATGVADVIYNPVETVLTAAARRLGIPACTGMTMLIAQAVEAQKVWHPLATFPEDIIQRLEKELKLF